MAKYLIAGHFPGLIADLKERLKIEMTSLLYEYFPGIPLNYRADENISNKYNYPEACDNAGEKKFDDYIQCGMCDGTADEKCTNAYCWTDKKCQTKAEPAKAVVAGSTIPSGQVYYAKNEQTK